MYIVNLTNLTKGCGNGNGQYAANDGCPAGEVNVCDVTTNGALVGCYCI